MSLRVSAIPRQLAIPGTIDAVHAQVAKLATLDWLALDRVALLGCLTVGFLVGTFQAAGAIADPFDAHMYWSVDPMNMYPAHWTGGYVNPPPLALVIGSMHPLGWPLFIMAFTTATWVAFWYCTRAFAPFALLASVAVVPLIGGNVVGYLFMGNVQMIMAAAIVASVRASPAWAVVPLLTKGVGIPLVWYAVRREWQNLALALASTTSIVAVTFLVAPRTWFDFAAFLSTNNLAGSPLPLIAVPYPVRLAAAVGLAAWGGLTDRRWTVPIAAGLAIPALYPWSYLAIWVGVIGIEWTGRERKLPLPLSAPSLSRDPARRPTGSVAR